MLEALPGLPSMAGSATPAVTSAAAIMRATTSAKRPNPDRNAPRGTMLSAAS